MNTLPSRLQALGHAAGVFQVSPDKIAEELERARVHPAITLNDLRYYDCVDIDEVVEILRMKNK